MTSGKQILKDPKRVQASVEKEEKEMLDEIRWRERNTESEIVRKAILEYIENHAEGNSTFKLDKWNQDPSFKAVPTISASSETWYKYLKDCTDEEITNFMVQTNRVNRQCKAIKGIR